METRVVLKGSIQKKCICEVVVKIEDVCAKNFALLLGMIPVHRIYMRIIIRHLDLSARWWQGITKSSCHIRFPGNKYSIFFQSLEDNYCCSAIPLRGVLKAFESNETAIWREPQRF